MLDKINYPTINAKLKGMYAKTLTKEDLEDLIKQNTIKDAIIILKTKIKPLENLNIDAKRIELEAQLDNIIINDIEKIYKYLKGSAKEIFDAYILKYKIKCLKIIWKNIQIGKQDEKIQEIEGWLEFFQDIKNIHNTKNKEEFLQSIKNDKLRKIFENSTNFFDLESKLYKFYLENLYKKVKGKSKELENEISTEIDFINILSIYRCKKYYGFYNKEYFINYGKILSKEKISDIEEANSIEDINEVLKETKYSKIVKNDVEKDFRIHIYKRYKKYFRENNFDISLIISYFYIQEMEETNIIGIIEGIRYKLDKEEIRKKIVK